VVKKLSIKDSDLYNLFIEDATEQIDNMEESILFLEENGFEQEAINVVFRMVHSLKGSSATMGLETMTELTHGMENLLDKIRSGEIDLDEEIINVLLECLDALKLMKKQIESRGEINYDSTALLSKISGFLQKKETPVLKDFSLTEYEELVLKNKLQEGNRAYKCDISLHAGVMMPAVTAFLIIKSLKEMGEVLKTWPEGLDDDDGDAEVKDTFSILVVTPEGKEITDKIGLFSEIKDVRITEFSDTERQFAREGKAVKEKVREIGEGKQPKVNTETEKRNSIRVDIGKIDKLMTLVGELIIDKERLLQLTKDLKMQQDSTKEIQGLSQMADHLNFLSNELQEAAMSIRMFPIENIFKRFPRLIRDTCHLTGKEVNFVMEGKDTELDRSVLEEIVDPLIHLLRNAVSHGIELPQEREAKGKNREGNVKLSAHQEENMIVLDVTDDGQGLDEEAIKRKAVVKGLITAEEAEKMAPGDAVNLIFLPGFSTVDVANEVSGRGVGLDVVKTNIEKLGGYIEVSSKLGEGSNFRIKLPLTLSIMKALIIKENGNKYAIPLSTVIETLRVRKSEFKESIKTVKKREVFLWREQVLPILRLNRYFGFADKELDKTFLVVVGMGERRIALCVEKLLGEQEIVIKSLGDFIGEGKLFGPIDGISGASIQGDGSIALILNIQSLIRENSRTQ
jgi:two-component system chemotaxis sensor kinase CheA